MEPDRVGEVLQQLRSGVRQRLAEVAVQGEASEEARQSLLAVRSREYVQEPVPFSHRRRLGKPIVWVRKAFYHLFLKWFERPILEQQNAFNQASGRLLQELVEGQERQTREQRLLAGRVASLEAAAASHPPGQDSGT
jgi:hypothetical protein